MHQPERTCVGCRTRRPQTELLRLRRRPDGHLMPARRVREGRSVYLCPARDCYDRALRRDGFARSLRGRLSFDATGLWIALQQDAAALAAGLDAQCVGKGGRNDG